MVAPFLQKVIAFHGESRVPSFAERAKDNLKMLGIELKLIPVTTVGSLKDKAGAAIKEADALWFINDPIVGGREAFEFLRDETIRQKKPLIASLSDQFAELGAFMTVAVDFKAIGAQAASMARQVLVEQAQLKDLGIRAPMAGRLTVNLDAANRIQLSVAPETLPNINRIIGTTED